MIGSFGISVLITSRVESKLFNTGACQVAREQPNNIFTSFTAENTGEKTDTANVQECEERITGYIKVQRTQPL